MKETVNYNWTADSNRDQIEPEEVVGVFKGSMMEENGAEAPVEPAHQMPYEKPPSAEYSEIATETAGF